MTLPDLDGVLPQIQAGDEQAFGVWMARAEPTLRASLRSFAAHVDVEAVLQETLLRTWQLAPEVSSDGRGNALLRFAHRIARNLALSELRRRRATQVDPEILTRLAEDAEPEPAEPPDPMLRRHIGDCRASLPSQPRLALEARLDCAGGDADATLAGRLGMKLNTFLQNVSRARKLLLACLNQRGILLEGETP